MPNKKKKQKRDLNFVLIPGTFMLAILTIKIVEIGFGSMFDFNLVHLGILPREASGLIGIITSPFIHGDTAHVASNALPILFLGMAFVFFYKESYKGALAIIYLLSGTLVWLFARTSYHIGASSLIYGLASFIFFSGIFRRDIKSIALALMVVFLYGGLVWGVLPSQPGISWEGHLFGALSGLLAAYIYRRKDPPKKYDWENEEDDDREYIAR